MTPIQYLAFGRTASEISVGIEAAIRAGDLRSDEALPTVRGLATDLDVAPGTVAAAYRTLRDRGLVQTQGRNGTVVRARPPDRLRSTALPAGPGVIDLGTGHPDPRLLPRVDLAMLRRSTGTAGAPTRLILPELLAIARSRFEDDGVPAAAVITTGGALDAISRLLSAQLRPGDLVAVEDPGWSNLLDLVAGLGLRPHPVGLDDQGPRPDSLRSALFAGARAFVVTSRAQNPTGVDVTAERAGALRAVLATSPSVLLIEDDHAAELSGVPLMSLAAATGTWAFVRSLSKPYGPDLRMAVVAGDAATIARVESRLSIDSGWVSTILQRLAVALWSSPGAAKSVARAARTYDARRAQLIDELATVGVAATGTSGLNVWVPVPDETYPVAALLQGGWAVAPGSRFRQASPPGIRVTVSELDQRSIPRFAADLAATLLGARAVASST